MPPESGLLENVQTLGELRGLVAGSGEEEPMARASESAPLRDTASRQVSALQDGPGSTADERKLNDPRAVVAVTEPKQPSYVYPRWPWWKPVQWARAAFIELIMRPLVRFLAKPRVDAPLDFRAHVTEPILIVANHVTAYDGALVQYALPGAIRRHVAAAMSGEMLEDFRHFRNPEWPANKRGFYPLGPLAWFALTALFNVFPLPRLRDFQRSFAHAGEALDRGYHVLVFPEGTRSASGQLARFRPGIGLLVKQSATAVLPVALRGLGELKARGKGWFRSGKLEVRVGEPIRFGPEDSEAAITEWLHGEVERLLGERSH
jgi:long-chain acyl-CoA synthetase